MKLNASHHDLRERLESTINSATKEWDFDLYDVVGVLTVYLWDLQHKINHEAEEEEEP